MHHIFKIGDRVVHRWVKKGYGRIVSMDEKGLMIDVEWTDGDTIERSMELWESLSSPPLMYPGHHPTCNGY